MLGYADDYLASINVEEQREFHAETYAYNTRLKLKRVEFCSNTPSPVPVAWRYINLYGQYEFHRLRSPIDINKIIS